MKRIIEILLLITLIITVGILFIVFFLFVKEKCNNSTLSQLNIESWAGMLISGLIGAIISSLVMYITITKNTEEKQMENQLKLRELFSEERRWKIHLVLSYIVEISRNGNEEKDIDCESVKITLGEGYFKWETDKKRLKKEDFELILKAHIYELYDYMGLFEIAYKMIRNKTLDKNLFETNYKYRLENLWKSTVVRNELNSSPNYWLNFRRITKIFVGE